MMEDINLELIKNIIPDECKNKFCVILGDWMVECFDNLDDALNFQCGMKDPTILYLPTEYFESL